MSLISPAQCRAARALLGLSQVELVKMSGVSEKTITEFERQTRSPYDRTLRDLKTALEVAGIIFIYEDYEGPGVRLRKQRPVVEVPVVVRKRSGKLRSAGLEDETRSGPEALERPGIETDD